MMAHLTLVAGLVFGFVAAFTAAGITGKTVIIQFNYNISLLTSQQPRAPEMMDYPRLSYPSYKILNKYRLGVRIVSV